ncbi:hypothetical protein KKG61_02510 [bacterium]|nr:hypothetical protein [bacterium]MBU1598972.1 hypothetical protein [bacterium]
MFRLTKVFGILLVLGMVSLVWAEKPSLGTVTEQALGTQTIEPKLIMEYKFDEPVVDVIFDEATMTVKEARALGMKGLEKRKATEKVKVQYPKVVVVGKRVKYIKSEGGYPYAEDFEELHPASIKFFSEKEKKKKEILLQEITPKGWRTNVGFSKNKKYIGVTSKITRYSQEWLDEGPSEAKFTMIDTNGQILWEAVTNLDEPFGISPNGQYIVCTGDTTGDYWDYMPSVWNSKGLVKKMFGEKEWYGVDPYLDFSKDGNWFAVIAGKGETILTENGRYGGCIPHRYLIVFDEKGNELWRKEIAVDPWMIDSMNISDDDVITVTMWHFYGAEKEKVYRFDKKGKLIEPKPKEEE